MEDKIKKIIKKEFGIDPREIKQTSGGFSHHMYEVLIDKEPFSLLIRFSNNSEKKERDLRKEVYVLEEMKKAGAPVPKIYIFRKNEEKEEHDYMLIEKIRGIRLDTIWNGLSKEEKIEITRKIGQLMKKIHSIQLGKFGNLEEEGHIEVETQFKFKTVGEQHEYSPFLRQFFKDHFKDIALLFSYEHIKPEFITKLIQFIAKNKKEIDYKGPPVLIHGDMHPGHIFVEKTNGEYEITGLIDVEFAEPSCPEYDFIKLHRTGFFDDPDLKKALKEGYGKINEKAVLIYRIMRDVGYARVLFDSGNNELAEKILKETEERINKGITSQTSH
jgi:aminoglycoside phosphotransferase (APT) family kinase protein